MSNYSEPSTENDGYVCPEVLAIGVCYGHSLNSQPPIPPDDGTVKRIDSDVNSSRPDPDPTEMIVVGINNSQSLSSISLDNSQDDYAETPEAEADVSSGAQFLPFLARDSTALTKTKPSSSLHKVLSIRSLQRRLAGKVGKDALDHINSVLRFSVSNSWRSSIVSFASSWKSRGSSILHKSSAVDDAGASTGSELSSFEQLSWNELVDETKLAPPTQARAFHQEMSLSMRPCCGTSDDLDEEFSCGTCGFSSAHNNGRHCVEIINRGFGTYVFSCFMGTVDRFGNTPLHFAAASSRITTTALKSIITSGVNIKARNTSGENFMHVLDAASLGGITEYLDLLRFLECTDFQFSDRDTHGRTIAHRFFDGYEPSEISMNELAEIFRLLRVDVSAVDNLGHDVGLSRFISGRRSGLVENPNDGFRRLLGRHCNPNYQKVDFRAMILSSLNRKIRSPMGIELLGPEDWLCDIRRKSLVKWVDINGDTPLTALVKYYPEIGGEEIMFRIMIRCLVSDGCDVNARDRHGYTALAIATRLGLRPIVSYLLSHGASVNTRSYRGTSTMSHAAERLHRARKSGNEKLYGTIISCIGLITDKGAKTEPSVYDEFGVC